MPRSYSFDHFTVPGSDADQDSTRRDKQEVAASGSPVTGHSDVHYGKKFAQTEAILKAKVAERARAEEAGGDAHLGSTEAQVSPTPAQPQAGTPETGMPGLAAESAQTPRRKKRKSGEATPETGATLGATPSEELPDAAEQALADSPAELVSAFRDQVVRSVRGIGDAARALRTAGRDVAGLPVEALRLGLRLARGRLGRRTRQA